MSAHAGMDRSTYPGDQVMIDLWNKTNLAWTGFYLAPAPSHGNASWMTKRAFLQNLGWGLAPLYLGQQTQGPGAHPSKVTEAQGAKDAAHAASLTFAAGFPSRSVIYLDFEQWDRPLKQGSKDYYAAWTQGIFDFGYYPGIYCSSHFAALFDAVDRRPVTWIYRVGSKHITYKNECPNPDTSDSGVLTASLWQWAQECNLKYKNDRGIDQILHGVDFSSADSLDPSNFLGLASSSW